MARDTAGNGSIVTTTDHETIRQWVEERGSTAARVTEPTGDDPGSLAVVPEGTDDDSVEEIPWDEFFEIFEEENLAFVYQTARDDPNERWFCRFVDRERDVSADAFAAERAGTTWSTGGRYEHEVRSAGTTETVGTVEDIEELTDESVVDEGEVAETEITRTEVIEKEIVVTDRVRSRVVGSEIVERNTLDSEVVDREIDRCEIVDDETVETEVLETRRVSEEVFEVHTVESEVVDSETVERERTEGRRDDANEPTIEEPAVDLADSGLEHGTIVESEIVRRDLEARELVEGEVVESEVVERRVIETEVVERILVRSGIQSAERIDSRLVDGELVESEILERDSSEREFTAATGSADSEPETIERGTTEPRVMVTEDEEGKRVVDAHGEEIGAVSAVREGTLYVDPNPGLTETITSSLGWGGGDESHPIGEERIERITDDAVEITRSEAGERP